MLGATCALIPQPIQRPLLRVGPLARVSLRVWGQGLAHLVPFTTFRPHISSSPDASSGGVGVAADPESDQDDTVQIANAFLANHAEVRDGVANILGGFPEWWTVQDFPQQVLVFVVIDLLLDDKELGQTFRFTIEVARPDNTTVQLGSVEMRRDKNPIDLPATKHHNIGVFPAPINLLEGTHIVTIQGSGESARMPFYARKITTP